MVAPTFCIAMHRTNERACENVYTRGACRVCRHVLSKQYRARFLLIKSISDVSLKEINSNEQANLVALYNNYAGKIFKCLIHSVLSTFPVFIGGGEITSQTPKTGP